MIFILIFITSNSYAEMYLNIKNFIFHDFLRFPREFAKYFAFYLAIRQQSNTFICYKHLLSVVKRSLNQNIECGLFSTLKYSLPWLSSDEGNVKTVWFASCLLLSPPITRLLDADWLVEPTSITVDKIIWETLWLIQGMGIILVFEWLPHPRNTMFVLCMIQLCAHAKMWWS